jgi:CRP-like cAMP-binding protein
MQQRFTELQEQRLFRNLAAEQLAIIARSVQQISVPPRTALMETEEEGDVVYFIHEGAVKVHLLNADGSSVILGIRGPGDSVGELSLIDQVGRSASVETLDRSILFVMNGAQFFEYVQTIPQLNLNLLRVLSFRLRAAATRSRVLATYDTMGRLAHHILAFAEIYGIPHPHGTLIPLSLNQSDLASLTGSSRVRINQMLQRFRAEGSITIEHQRIIVCLPESLAGYCR